jgi:hypothetical protein
MPLAPFLAVAVALLSPERGLAARDVAVVWERGPVEGRISARYPILVAAFGVAVTEASDRRSYDAIRRDVAARGLRTGLQRIADGPEETFEEAAAHVRSPKCHTWLGLGRDMRIFAVGERLDWIQPRSQAEAVTVPELGARPVSCQIRMGRGWGPVEHITRRLEDGVLPILHGTLVDGDVRYEVTAFVSLERSPLVAGNVQGTDAFSKAFYNAAASLADRETYTFWEHYFHASPHKTHEEAWFLMENRWRLYLGEGDTSSVLPGIPRAYLEDGKRIEIDGMKSYFGPVRLSVRSELAQTTKPC